MKQVYLVPAKKANTPDGSDGADSPASFGLGADARLGGILAIRFAAFHIPLLWPLALLLSIPFTAPFWKASYRWVAERRYRWGKYEGSCEDGGTCSLHFGESKKRDE